MNRATCVYCGHENITAGDVWVCNYCEMAMNSANAMSKLGDGTLQESLKAVNGGISAGNFDAALAEYEKLAAKYKEPQFYYREGLICFQQSNAEVEQVRYDRKGFMEENAVHRANASKIESKAKTILYKASVLCQTEMKSGIEDPFLGFAYFMINVKIGNLKTAKDGIAVIDKHGNAYLSGYANMVFSAELGRYWDVIAHANALTKSDMFSPNAYYYIAWALFKLRRHRESMHIVRELEKYIKTGSVYALMHDIQKTSTI